MKYKVGDKVRIKDGFVFNGSATSAIGLLDSDRTFIVYKIKGGKYLLKGLRLWEWEERWLEIPNGIVTRFELMDI